MGELADTIAETACLLADVQNGEWSDTAVDDVVTALETLSQVLADAPQIDGTAALQLFAVRGALSRLRDHLDGPGAPLPSPAPQTAPPPRRHRRGLGLGPRWKGLATTDSPQRSSPRNA
ncbi:hypothetical protein [Streptomyces fradiae]|uniref:hypothetical protein n=1 Tax=Streptomyces fradiae TaxID=1906 RepID=UPI0033C8423A